MGNQQTIVNDAPFEGKFQVVDPGNIWLLHNVFSEEECQQFLEASEKIGYGEAPLTVGDNTYLMNKDVRNNSRAMIDNVDYSNLLYDRIKEYLPKKASELSSKFVSQKLAEDYELVGLNERIRFYKYEVNQYFAPHYDGCFIRNGKETINGTEVETEEKSFITVLLYLNDVHSGGETNFLNDRNESVICSVKPKRGQVLMFVHWNYHEGSILSDPNEYKYVMRSDAMYKRVKKHK